MKKNRSINKKILLYYTNNQNIVVYLQHQRQRIMAKPIKETPILYGEDARRFEARMNERRNESPEEKADRLAAYELIMSIMEP